MVTIMVLELWELNVSSLNSNPGFFPESPAALGSELVSTYVYTCVYVHVYEGIQQVRVSIHT